MSDITEQLRALVASLDRLYVITETLIEWDMSDDTDDLDMVIASRDDAEAAVKVELEAARTALRGQG